MRRILYIECGCEGLLTVNGQFCGPLESGGQAFPMGDYAQAYIQFTAYDPRVRPLAAVLELRDGRISRLEPQEHCYALVWPDGVIQLELRAQGDEAQAAHAGEEAAAPDTLLRYLAMRLAGDGQARFLLMQQDERIAPDLSPYHAVVPLRFASALADDRFDMRAGLVRRAAPNIAVVDAALAATVPAGQGRKLIERIELIRT